MKAENPGGVASTRLQDPRADRLRYLNQLDRGQGQGKAQRWVRSCTVIAAFDFFIVRTLPFQTLYCLLSSNMVGDRRPQAPRQGPMFRFKTEERIFARQDSVLDSAILSPPTCSLITLAMMRPRSVSSAVLASRRAKMSMSGATSPVQPV